MIQNQTPLFRSYVMVDWSARNQPSPASPKTAKDAIWFALVERVEGEGPRLTQRRHCRTRAEAQTVLGDLLADLAQKGRVLIGFDFPFGYPAGTANYLGYEGLKWRKLWARIIAEIDDASDNSNNRLAAAARLNREFGDTDGPFWGYPHNAKAKNPGLPIRKPDGYGETLPAERRLAERWAKGAETVWHLAGGAGVVGSQVLLGLPVLWALRTDPRLAAKTAIWPFETGLADDPRANVVVAEIWPSLLNFGTEPDMPKDATQVRAVAEHLAMTDQEGELAALLQGPPNLSDADRRAIEEEEAWILGLMAPETKAQSVSPKPLPQTPAQTPTPTPVRYDYEKNPNAIYAQSFAQIDAAVVLSRFPPSLQPVARRIIHACGRVDAAGSVAWAGEPVAAISQALAKGRPVLVDVAMVAQGVIKRWLPKGVDVICTLNDPATPGIAARLETTRSAAAVELWREHIDGAVVVVGNAPTALFHLLERLSEDWPRPAAIIGMPVGFVGAAESKQALADFAEASGVSIPFITLHGREGGSAIAAAALNACLAPDESPP